METYFGEIEQRHSCLARERVLTDLRTLTRDSEDLLAVTAHDATEAVRAARGRLATAVDRSKSTIIAMQQQAMAAAKAGVQKADATIRSHPYQSLGAAFGLGLLIGVLAMRARREAED